METKHLSYFKVENFKRFDSLEVNDIGQFNLIVGDNNVGKTSLLEALLFDENKNKFLVNLYQCLVSKKIFQHNDSRLNNLDLNFLSNEKTKEISYSYKYDKEPRSISILQKAITQIDPSNLENLQRIFLSSPPENSRLNYGLIEFNINGDTSYELASIPNYEMPLFYMPYVSFDTLYDNDLVTFFSQLSISNTKLETMIKDFSFLIPNLVSIEINSALIPNKASIAIRETNKDLMLLSQYGDGTKKLFRYLLELEFCENNRLMIDEIETGIHYSRMKDFLKKVLQSAKTKNVQIFATTHSKECIESYAKALTELGYENDARIIKIADTKNGIKSYTSNYAQFENSLEAESEIR